MKIETNSSSNQAINGIIDECDTCSYLLVCFAYMGGIMVCAILIDDLTLVFGLIGAFSETMLNFVFPGLFFVIGYKIAKTNRKRSVFEETASNDDHFRLRQKSKSDWCRHLPVVIFIVIGIAFFFVSNYFNLLKILRL